MGRRVQQFHHHREAVVKTHSILGHLGILVARRQMTQSADGGLGDVLSVAGAEHRSHQGFDASNLSRGEPVWKKRANKDVGFQRRYVRFVVKQEEKHFLKRYVPDTP